VQVRDARQCASDTLSPDNGGGSGTAYWGVAPVQPAAPRSIHRPRWCRARTIHPALWPPLRRLLVL